MPFLTRPTFRFHYDDLGPRDGAAVVLMPSLLCDREMFAHLASNLADRYRVLAVDLRGHGFSTAPSRAYDLEEQADDIAALLDSVGIARAALVGLSQGGMTALRLVLARRERVRAMVLMDSSADSEGRVPALRYLAMAASARLFGVLPSVAHDVTRLMFSDAFASAHRDIVARHVSDWQAMDRRGIFHATRAVALRTDLAERLREIDVPTLVIVGDQDRALPPPHSYRLARAIKNAKLAIVAGAGHLATIEQPEATTALVRQFLDDQLAGA